MKTKLIESTFLGLALADALGVPVEFKSRQELKDNPVIDMREYGSHHQPKGTWSDDSSLTFCLAESLCKKYDTNDIANNFSQWYKEVIWTPHGKIFDIGNGTRKAIDSYLNGDPATLAGGTSEYDNGNGSLMRISPLVFYIKDFPIEKRFDIIKDVSSITHGHIRSVISCFIYLEFLLQVLKDKNLKIAYENMQQSVLSFLINNPICSQKEIDIFQRILNNNIAGYKEDEIYSSGYVVHTLEASLWCLLKTSNYTESVFKAINLGDDTDTTATVVGAIAGMYYGLEDIPKEWLDAIARKQDIIVLSRQFSKKYGYED